MNPKYDFAGQVALVTGASSGMGFVTARAFAEQGASVALADVNERALSAATDELTAAGHRVLGVVCDVADEAQVAAAVERIVATFGRLDMAFNNAGIMIAPSDAADEPAGNFDRVNTINLRGVWACMKHELRQMREQGSGAIVHCSSLGSGASRRSMNRSDVAERERRKYWRKRPRTSGTSSYRSSARTRHRRRSRQRASSSFRTMSCGDVFGARIAKGQPLDQDDQGEDRPQHRHKLFPVADRRSDGAPRHTRDGPVSRESSLAERRHDRRRRRWNLDRNR